MEQLHTAEVNKLINYMVLVGSQRKVRIFDWYSTFLFLLVSNKIQDKLVPHSFTHVNLRGWLRHTRTLSELDRLDHHVYSFSYSWQSITQKQHDTHPWLVEWCSLYTMVWDSFKQSITRPFSNQYFFFKHFFLYDLFSIYLHMKRKRPKI